MATDTHDDGDFFGERGLTVRDDVALVPAKTITLTRAAVMASAAALATRAAGIVKVVADTYDEATDLLKQLKQTRREIERHHDAQKGVINDVRNRALDLERTDLNVVKPHETRLGSLVLDFDRERERARKAEEDRLRREALAKAEEEQRAAAAALKAAAKIEDDPEMQKALRKQAREVAAAPVLVAPVVLPPVVTKPGLAKRTTWSADITNIELLVVAIAARIIADKATVYTPDVLATLAQSAPPLDAIEPDALAKAHPYLNDKARSSREDFTMPGVVAVCRETL